MGTLIEYKIAFVGQTRRGKSTLLNKLFGTQFDTESIVECTTRINSSTFIYNDISGRFNFLTVMDTPGLGASLESDIDYTPYYAHVFEVADCIVWVTNMQRTDALDQKFFIRFKEQIRPNTKIIACLNGIDKVSPHDIDESAVIWDNEKNEPTPILQSLIDSRKELIRSKFSKYIPSQFRVLETNAFTGYGLDLLKKEILK